MKNIQNLNEFTVESHTIYRPKDFCIGVDKLFPKEKNDWKVYASTDNFLRIRPEVVFTNIGISGKLILGNPPSNVEIDAWEASKVKGVWDYWKFLGFMMLPFGSWAKRELIIFYEQNTFFNQDFEIVHRLNVRTLSDVEEFAFENGFSGDLRDDEESLLKFEWQCLLLDLKSKLDIQPIQNKEWNVEGVLYTIEAPDEFE